MAMKEVPFLDGVAKQQQGSRVRCASSTGGTQKETVCCFFLTGTCKKGDYCKFDHIRPATVTGVQGANLAQAKARTPCKFLALGKCIKGSNCKYSHTARSASTGAIRGACGAGSSGLASVDLPSGPLAGPAMPALPASGRASRPSARRPSRSPPRKGLMAAMDRVFAGSALTGQRQALHVCPLEVNVIAGIAEDDQLLKTFGVPDQVTDDMMTAVCERTKAQLASAIRAIAAAQRVSLCFVVDTTGSMARHIQGVKDQVRAIVEQVRKSGCQVAGLAFVGYKDWCDGKDHFEVLRFGGDAAHFERFVAEVTADGGGDAPEDVVGGLQQAVKLEWPRDSGSRVIFHIADAPPHGRKGGRGQQYHELEDSYPDGHAADIPLKNLFGDMQSKGVDYYFGKINESCKGMLDIFGKHLGKRIEPCDVFDPVTITSSVVASIMDSVSHRSTAACCGPQPTAMLPPLDKSLPIWSTVPVVSTTIMTCDLPEDVDHIRSMEPLAMKVVTSYVQVAPRPFANGSLRVAFHARRLFTHTDSASSSPTPIHDVPLSAHGPFFAVDEIVLKEFIKPSDDVKARAPYIVALDTQAVAAKLAQDFNAQLEDLAKTGHLSIEGAPIRLKYLMAKVARLSTPDASGMTGGYRYMAMEKKFRGEVEMVKYTNNYEFVRSGDSKEFQDRAALAVAFSHFTWEHTEKFCMVTDIQGVDTKDGKDRDTMLLTDPAIHCPGVVRFGKTNMQQAGIDAFFKVHVCNHLCKALGLRHPRAPSAATALHSPLPTFGDVSLEAGMQPMAPNRAVRGSSSTGGLRSCVEFTSACGRPGTPGTPGTLGTPTTGTPGSPGTPGTPASLYSLGTPGPSVTPGRPGTPGALVTPVRPATPSALVTPGWPTTPSALVTPGRPATPTSGRPGTPGSARQAGASPGARRLPSAARRDASPARRGAGPGPRNASPCPATGYSPPFMGGLTGLMVRPNLNTAFPGASSRR